MADSSSTFGVLGRTIGPSNIDVMWTDVKHMWVGAAEIVTCTLVGPSKSPMNGPVSPSDRVSFSFFTLEQTFGLEMAASEFWTGDGDEEVRRGLESRYGKGYTLP
jgi:hypothetical protein